MTTTPAPAIGTIECASFEFDINDGTRPCGTVIADDLGDGWIRAITNVHVADNGDAHCPRHGWETDLTIEAGDEGSLL